MNKDKRIEEKKSELMELYKDLPEDQLTIVSDLVAQAAFMSVELQDLADLISEEGMTEEYTNGANQSGRKISSNAKIYSSLIGKYNTIINGLIKLLPDAPDPAILQRQREKAEREASIRLDCEQRTKAAAEQRRKEDLFYQALKAGEVTQDQYHEFMASL